MTLIKATENDFERLTRFYRHAIAETKNIELYARWIYGLHPSDKMILGYITSGNMFFSEANGNIASAVAAVPCQENEYHDVPWKLEAADDEVSAVHILCVAPEFQKKGIAARTMHRVIEMSRESGKKAVRLDALKCNTPARCLYESLGFSTAAERNWHTENAGWTDFVLYELEV